MTKELKPSENLMYHSCPSCGLDYADDVCLKGNKTIQQQQATISELQAQLANAKADGIEEAVINALCTEVDFSDYGLTAFRGFTEESLYEYANQLRNNSGE